MSPAGLLVAGAIAILPHAVLAQSPAQAREQSPEPSYDTTQPDITRLDNIVVTAARQSEDALLVPAAIDVISVDELRRAQARISLSETLQRVPGVFARDRHNPVQGLQISIRGFGARANFGIRGLRLYTDGIPATTPDGQGDVGHFMLQSAQRIEILRGPFSALYGNASGGVIAVFTADAPPDPQLTAGVVAGEFGLWKRSLSWHAPWGKRDDGSLLLDAVHVDRDGFREHSASQQRNSQALLKGTFGGSGDYTLLFNGYRLQADDPSTLSREQIRDNRRAASGGAIAFDARTTVAQDQFGAHVEQQLSPDHTLIATAWTGRRETFQVLPIPVAVQDSPLQDGGVIDLERDYYGVDARWRWSSELLERPFSLTTGVDYEVADDRRRGYENFAGDMLGVVGALRRDEHNRVSSHDVYAQAIWQPAASWRINVGARHSRVRFESDDFYITADNPDDSGLLEYSRTSPVAGVLFRLAPQISVYANAGYGFATPTFSELAYRSDGLSGLNDDLRPARSRNYEIGVRARHDTLEYSATAFQSRTEDELIVASNQDGRSTYANAGVTRRRGFEFALSAKLAPHWHVATAYTFLDARYATAFAVCATPPCAQEDVLIEAGRRIPGLARNVAWAELRWSPSAHTDVMLEGSFVDRVYVDDANSQAAPAYAVANLAVERRFQFAGLQWRGFARLDNLFDRHYIGSVRINAGGGRYYEPAPGRSWILGLQVSEAFD